MSKANRFRFRCWNPHSKEMMTSKNDAAMPMLYCDGKLRICYDRVDVTDDLILMQSTGLCDKNGQEIFEGDILKCDDTNEDHESFNTEVWFYEGKFLTRHYAFPVSSWACGDNSYCEVIGNIHENPNLLKSTEAAHAQTD